MAEVTLKRFVRGAAPTVKQQFGRDLLTALTQLGVPYGGEFVIRNKHEQVEMAEEKPRDEITHGPGDPEPCMFCKSDSHERAYGWVDGTWGWFCRHVTYCKQRQHGEALWD